MSADIAVPRETTGFTATNACRKEMAMQMLFSPSPVAVSAGSEIACTPLSKECLLQAAVVLPVRESTQMERRAQIDPLHSVARSRVQRQVTEWSGHPSRFLGAQ